MGSGGLSFRFTRTEQAAVLLLTGILLAGIGVRLYRARQPVRGNFDAGAYFAALDRARQERAAAAAGPARAQHAVPVVPVPAIPAVININTATEAQLQSLPRIGPAMAARIITYRRENGPYPGIDALLHVKGIGPKTLERFRNRITAGEGQ